MGEVISGSLLDYQVLPLRHEINKGIPQVSLLVPTTFPLYINDLPKDIGHRSIVNIYIDNNTVNGSATKGLDD